MSFNKSVEVVVPLTLALEKPLPSTELKSKTSLVAPFEL